MKTSRRQLEDEYRFLCQFIKHENQQRPPSRKLLELLYDLRFALAVELKTFK